MKEQTYIFFIAVNCGIILKKALETFHECHPGRVVHIFGTYKDFKEIGKPGEFDEFIDVSGDAQLMELYKHGHQGTAMIHARVIDGQITNLDQIVHLDSDCVFFGDVISEIEQKFEENFDLIGPCRPYKFNLCKRDDVRQYQDTVATYLVGYRRSKIPKTNFYELWSRCGGYQWKHPVLDFFDPVSFSLIESDAKIFYLDKEKYGSPDHEGNKQNSMGRLNEMMDAGNLLYHYAGIGSGRSFFNNPENAKNVPQTYVDWAIGRYRTYMCHYYNQNLGPVDEELLEELKRQELLREIKHLTDKAKNHNTMVYPKSL